MAYVLIALCSLPPVQAHLETDEALVRLNAQIVASADDAARFMQRGDRYSQPGDHRLAQANFRCAAELNPRLPGLARLWGRAELRAGAVAAS